LKRTAETEGPSVEKMAQPRAGNQGRQVCPKCGEARVRRSRRRTVPDFLLGIFGLRTYRCHECEYRYHSRGQGQALPRRSRWVECPRCGFAAVDPIARHKVPPTWVNLPQRMLLYSAYRCPECRKRFFDSRSRRPQEEKTV
jgi:DNA-directed RNA polymerase subunit RPC12/RpoP